MDSPPCDYWNKWDIDHHIPFDAEWQPQQFLLIAMISLNGIAWLAAAKIIEMYAASSSQQQSWWVLLAACSSSNTVRIISEALRAEDETIADTGQASFYVIGLVTLIVIAAISYKKHQIKSDEASKVEVCHPWYRVLFILAKSCNFWFIIALNNVLWSAKWVVFSFVTFMRERGLLQGRYS